MTTIHIEKPFPNVTPRRRGVVEDWFDLDDPPAGRYWACRNRVVDRLGDTHKDEPICVYVAGMQYAAGSIAPEIVVHELHADEPIKSSATARQLARALMAAADDFDRLT
jgi:hypothetical protein